jgi:LL-diaminopimelate aminotransferase
MLARNPNIAALESGYLFPEINKRKQQFLKDNPTAKLISLGIGDATEPLTPTAVQGLVDASAAMGTTDGYAGYGPEQGIEPLRTAIAQTLYRNKVDADEVFISDGAKCDVGRLQVLLGADASIAVQDPVYPVYLDTGRIIGQKKIFKMTCNVENNFFPATIPQVDVIYFCSPNNPTGATATRKQLEHLVATARNQNSLLIYDAAYSAFIQDPEIPRSIYEIPGSKEVAIEINSFSKNAGFTGVRLGWTIVPKNLKYRDGSSIHKDWLRIVATFFNGASIIVQKAACNLLTDNGMKEVSQRVAFYLENAKIIMDTLDQIGWPYYGGVHIPYIWVKGPAASSWELFDTLLKTTGIVTTPGSGFGTAGEGYLRLSAFGHRHTIIEAARRLNEHFNKACV